MNIVHKCLILPRSIPWRGLWRVVQVIWSGIEKHRGDTWYKARTWPASYWLGKEYRHLDAYIAGCDLDRESGRHHLAHLACDALMHLSMIERGVIEDDREYVLCDRLSGLASACSTEDNQGDVR